GARRPRLTGAHPAANRPTGEHTGRRAAARHTTAGHDPVRVYAAAPGRMREGVGHRVGWSRPMTDPEDLSGETPAAAQPSGPTPPCRARCVSGTPTAPRGSRHNGPPSTGIGGTRRRGGPSRSHAGTPSHRYAGVGDTCTQPSPLSHGTDNAS